MGLSSELSPMATECYPALGPDDDVFQKGESTSGRDGECAGEGSEVATGERSTADLGGLGLAGLELDPPLERKVACFRNGDRYPSRAPPAGRS
jgi:hypothetical protein